MAAVWEQLTEDNVLKTFRPSQIPWRTCKELHRSRAGVCEDSRSLQIKLYDRKIVYPEQIDTASRRISYCRPYKDDISDDAWRERPWRVVLNARQSEAPARNPYFDLGLFRVVETRSDRVILQEVRQIRLGSPSQAPGRTARTKRA